MSKRLFVGGLPYETTSQQLQELFSQHGAVQDCIVVIDKATGRSKGFGFVEMAEEDAQKATEALNGSELGGRKIVVSEARPLQPRA